MVAIAAKNGLALLQAANAIQCSGGFDSDANINLLAAARAGY